jgi:hypothetical protein
VALRAAWSVHESATPEVVAECAPIMAPVVAETAPIVAPGSAHLFAMSGTGGEEPVAAAIVRPEPVAAAIVKPEPVATVVEPETLHLAMPRLVPARERVMAETAGPRLRAQVPPGVAIVPHHLSAVAQDDAEAERGAHVPVRKVRPVRLGRRLADGQGAEGGGE